MESSIALTIASILNARRDGAVIFGAYGFPAKRVVGVRLGDGDPVELKREFQRKVATKLDRFFGVAQRKVLAMIEVVFEKVVEVKEETLDEDGESRFVRRRSVVEDLFVIRIRVEGRRCAQIIDAPAKGRNGR